MDAKDDQILEILSQDGRISFSDLGAAIGLSVNATAARVHRLEHAGVILGYRAVLAHEQPDPTAGIEAFVDVRLREGQDSDEFLAWARCLPPVIDAAHVTGPYDFHVRIRVRDMAALDSFLRTIKKDGGASQTQTRIALR